MVFPYVVVTLSKCTMLDVEKHMQVGKKKKKTSRPKYFFTRLWWIIFLRAYGKITGDYAFQERGDVQTGIRLILNLCLSNGFDMFPTLLVTDGSCMIDRRMGIHGHPLEIQGVEMVDNDYFITEENIGMLKLAKEENTTMFDYRIPLPETCSATAGSAMATSDSSLHMNGLPIGIYAPETVGCVVVDSYGNCTAATSTGGLMNKINGRIGDSPLIGAGTYACDICAVSCTGEGEAIIRSTLAREVGAVMEYKGVGL